MLSIKHPRVYQNRQPRTEETQATPAQPEYVILTMDQNLLFCVFDGVCSRA